MFADRIEAKWIDAFCEIFAKCAVARGDTAAILSETQSRALNVQMTELASAPIAGPRFCSATDAPVERIGTGALWRGVGTIT